MPVASPVLPTLAGWLCLALAAWSGWRAAGEVRPYRRWLWWAALGLALVSFRWPLIVLPYGLYPDEEQLLAGAITLREDPLFWRALNMGTAGPLDCYVLLPAAWFPGATAYAIARLTGTGLVWATLVAVGETLFLLTGVARARWAALPALLFLMFTTSPEYIHFSTELVANLLIALGALAGATQHRQPARRNLWLAGLLLGAVPWAKLQLVPLAGGLGLLLCAGEFAAGRRRDAVLLVGAALLPTALVLGVLTSTGQMEHMVMPYVVGNTLYVQSGRQTVAHVASQLWEQAVVNGYLAVWLAGAGLFCIASAIAALPRPGRAGRNLAFGGLAALGLAAVCILSPGRPYPHYLQILLIPVTLLVGAALAAWSQARTGFALFMVCLVVPLLGWRLAIRSDPYAYYNLVASAPSAGHTQLVAKIKSLARPGEPLGLWGWRSSLYVEAGLRQATRETSPLMLMIAGPAQGYFLRSYYEKFVESAPPVFVDATGPGNFYFTDRRQGHEIYPLLRDWVAANYTLVADLDGARVYARNLRPGDPGR